MAYLGPAYQELKGRFVVHNCIAVSHLEELSVQRYHHRTAPVFLLYNSYSDDFWGLKHLPDKLLLPCAQMRYSFSRLLDAKVVYHSDKIYPQGGGG